MTRTTARPAGRAGRAADGRRGRRRRRSVPLAALLVAAVSTAGVAIPAARSVASAGPPPVPCPLPAAAPGGTPGPGTCATATVQRQVDTLSSAVAFWRAHYATDASLEGHPGPVDIFDYDVAALWDEGIDGAGTTIGVIGGWGDPGVASTLAGFDARLHLPQPTVTTLYPDGPLPTACPAGMLALGHYGSCTAWEGELDLDVESAHLIAPYAHIVITATPADSEIADDRAAQVAPPELMKAVEYLSSRHLADVITISDGTSETTFTYGDATLRAENPAELTAAAAGVPVLVATGDCGVVQTLATATDGCGVTSRVPETAAWDDSPWVTAVGGSIPNVHATGRKAGADPLWPGSGAGYSSVYPRPSFQDAVDRGSGATMRSVPDITMDSTIGTSEAAPSFAGVLALATQLDGGRVLGPVNPALYRIGPKGAADGIEDVTQGTDAFQLHTGKVVRGFRAKRGFDVASGWGTVDAAAFAPSIDQATVDDGFEHAARRRAGAALRSLERLRLTPAAVARGSSTYLLGRGFLPMHPVTLSVDGSDVATLTATRLGTVTAVLDPHALGLGRGPHTVRLTGMLLTETGRLLVR
jgi:hypothetical protein